MHDEPIGVVDRRLDRVDDVVAALVEVIGRELEADRVDLANSELGRVLARGGIRDVDDDDRRSGACSLCHREADVGVDPLTAAVAADDRDEGRLRVGLVDVDVVVGEADRDVVLTEPIDQTVEQPSRPQRSARFVHQD